MPAYSAPGLKSRSTRPLRCVQYADGVGAVRVTQAFDDLIPWGEPTALRAPDAQNRVIEQRMPRGQPRSRPAR